MQLQPLKQKWEAFGWETYEVDGHDREGLIQLLQQTPKTQPRAIVAHTIKGKGISFMEDDNNWHYRIPTAQEVLLAKKELGLGE